MGEISVGERAQSSVLGVVLVFAIVIAGSTLTVALGAEAFSSTNDRLQGERAEQSMTQLDSQIAMVGLGSSDLQQVELSGSGTDYVVRDDAGTMEVSYTNLSNDNETTVFREEMGAVVYQQDGTEIAYQGGGVWRLSEAGGAVMISPPEFHYRSATLTLPLVTVSGDGSLGGDGAVIAPNGSKRYFPNESIDSDFRNPLAGSKVQVTVESEYYEAWGEYFEQRTEGEVTYDHPNEAVTIELVTPLEDTSVTHATASLAASGTFEIQGSAIETCGVKVYSNSYNSSGTSDDYCDQANAGTWGHEGDIVYGQDIDIADGAGGSYIYGDVVSGGSVKVSGSDGDGQPYVYGNINYSSSCQTEGGPSSNTCADRIKDPDGEVNQIDRMATASAIGSVVRNTVTEYRQPSTNDNGVTNVSGQRLDFGAAGPTDTVELSSGTYYLERIDPGTGEDRVVLDTSDGDVRIAVKRHVHLDGETIDVVGDGEVYMYVFGSGATANGLELTSGAEITNPGDDAPQFRLLAPSNFTAQIGGGGARYVGVIYAPPGPSGTGSVTLAGGEVFGGVVTGTTTIQSGNGGSLHYDEALDGKQMLTRGTSVARVTYLHVSTNDVNVTSP